MGYSIATPIKSKRLRDKVAAFLAVEFRSWPVLNGKPEGTPSYASKPMPDGYGFYTESPGSRNLDYDRGSCRIGFNFNAFEGERELIFGVCRWLALRFGKEKLFRGLEDKANYMVYDGEESWPVLVKGDWNDIPKKWSWAVYDRFGGKFPGAHDKRMKAISVGLYQQTLSDLAKVRSELRRLDKAWEKYSK